MMNMHDRILADIHQAVDGVRFAAKDGWYGEGELISVEVLALRRDNEQDRRDLELRINPHGPDPSTPDKVLKEGREAFASMLFKDDAEPAIRASAALAAGRLACDGAVRKEILDRLLSQYKDGDALVELAVSLALGELSAPTGADRVANLPRNPQKLAPMVARIAKALHDDDPQAWQKAMAVAENYHHRTAEEVLTVLLGDRGDRRIRCQAIRQLEALSCPSVSAEALACIPFVFKTEASLRYVFTTPQGRARIPGVGADSEVTLTRATDSPRLFAAPTSTTLAALGAKSIKEHDATRHDASGCSLVEVSLGADALLASVDPARQQVQFRTRCKWLSDIRYTLSSGSGGEAIRGIVHLSEDADGNMTGLASLPALGRGGWEIEFEPVPSTVNDEIRQPVAVQPPDDG